MFAELFDDCRLIKIVTSDSRHKEYFEFAYNGEMMQPDGPGHGRVVSQDFENIHFWQQPECEGGIVIIDDEFSDEKLESHGIFISNLAQRGSR